MPSETSHSILLFNDSKGELVDSRQRELPLLSLPHPKGCTVLFAMVGDSVYELQSAEPRRFGSWFINQRVVGEANFYIANKIDPRFLVLPYFEKDAGKKYSPLDQIVIMGDGHDRIPLQTAVKAWKLDEMLDMKDLGDDLVLFRYNEEKMLSLLKSKVKKAAAVICVHRQRQSKSDTTVSTFNVAAQEALGGSSSSSGGLPAAAAAEAAKTVEALNTDDIVPSSSDTLEAVQLISDYLTDECTKLLAASLGLDLGDINTVSMKGSGGGGVGEKRKADWELELEMEKETAAYAIGVQGNTAATAHGDTVRFHSVILLFFLSFLVCDDVSLSLLLTYCSLLASLT
jgi:hypothetical protein